MAKNTKIALGVLVALGLFIELLWWQAIQPGPDLSHPLTVKFLGYTNPPEAQFHRFARFVVSNESKIELQLMGSAVHEEGAPVFNQLKPNPKIPATSLPPFLKPGETSALWVREPGCITNGIPWRAFVVGASHAWRDQFRNFVIKYKLPAALASNGRFLTAEGPWLGADTNAAPLLCILATNPAPPVRSPLLQNASTIPVFSAYK